MPGVHTPVENLALDLKTAAGLHGFHDTSEGHQVVVALLILKNSMK